MVALVGCSPPMLADQRRQRSLIVNFEATINAIPLYTQLKNALNDNVFATFATQSFATFLITSFSQSSPSTSPQSSFYLATNFSDYKLRCNGIPLVNSQGIPQPVFGGLVQALTPNSALFKSDIWTLITSSPQTVAQDIIDQITVQAIRWQTRVNRTFWFDYFDYFLLFQLFFVVAISSASDSSSFASIKHLTEQTGGHLIFSVVSDVSQVTLHHSESNIVICRSPCFQIVTQTIPTIYLKDTATTFDTTSTSSNFHEDMVLSGKGLAISTTGSY